MQTLAPLADRVAAPGVSGDGLPELWGPFPGVPAALALLLLFAG